MDRAITAPPLPVCEFCGKPIIVAMDGTRNKITNQVPVKTKDSVESSSFDDVD